MQPPPTSSRSIFLHQTADVMPESRTAFEGSSWIDFGAQNKPGAQNVAIHFRPCFGKAVLTAAPVVVTSVGLTPPPWLPS